jgi:hypothetical protein
MSFTSTSLKLHFWKSLISIDADSCFWLMVFTGLAFVCVRRRVR